VIPWDEPRNDRMDLCAPVRGVDVSVGALMFDVDEPVDGCCDGWICKLDYLIMLSFALLLFDHLFFAAIVICLVGQL